MAANVRFARLAVWLVGAIAGAILIMMAMNRLLDQRQAMKAKITAARMKELRNEIWKHPNEEPSDEALERWVNVDRAERVLKDGWGHRILLEFVEKRNGGRSWELRSLGRDGQRGSCCRADTGWDWDADAVLDEDGWRQCWNWLYGGHRLTERQGRLDGR